MRLVNEGEIKGWKFNSFTVTVVKSGFKLIPEFVWQVKLRKRVKLLKPMIAHLPI